MAPELRHARVVIPGTQKTRDPAIGAESRAIVEYVQAYALEMGTAPIAVHEVPGVGDVWFMLPPPRDQ